MAQGDLLKSLLDGSIPKNNRLLIARGLAPIPLHEMLELLVRLLEDTDSEIASQAARTLSNLDEEEVLAQLTNRNCSPSVLEYFAAGDRSDRLLQAIVTNPSSPEKIIESLARTVPVHLLEVILDNRMRLIEFPGILENARQNPSATPEIQRLVQEIEAEFFGGKKKEYAVEEPAEPTPSPIPFAELESEVPMEDLSLEGLPLDGEARQAAIIQQLSTLSVRDKIKYALFGNREIRAVLVRDSNKEVAGSVLQSPKLTDSEIESIAGMRSVAEDILREIGNHKKWTKSYAVVQNLVRNPKTPPLISQRLLFRLRTQDLTMIARDRSIPDAVRQNASRAMKQRTSGRSGQ
jgi:hypothetical protein